MIRIKVNNIIMNLYSYTNISHTHGGLSFFVLLGEYFTTYPMCDKLNTKIPT